MIKQEQKQLQRIQIRLQNDKNKVIVLTKEINNLSEQAQETVKKYEESQHLLSKQHKKLKEMSNNLDKAKDMVEASEEFIKEINSKIEELKN